MITSWKELPIGKFQKIVGINDLKVDDDTKTFMTVALLNDMEYDEFISLPLAKASELVAASSFLYDEPKKVKVRRTYEIGGMTFRMMRNVMDLTTAQYIDYQGIVRLGMEKSLPSMMAIVLIPEGHNYNEGYDMDEVREILTDNLNVEDAFAIADFFSRAFGRSIRRLLLLSDAMMDTAVIQAPRRHKEAMRALRLEMRLITGELRSGFGSLSSRRSGR